MFIKLDHQLKTKYRAVKRAGKVRRLHRFLMEQHIGRTLLTSEHVHHINNNKLDNRLENLEVKLAAVHLRDHNSRIKPRPCPACDRLFKPAVDSPTNGARVCSVDCGAEYRAKIKIEEVILIESRRRSGEKLGELLKLFGFNRKAYEQRRRSLVNRGKMPPRTTRLAA